MIYWVLCALAIILLSFFFIPEAAVRLAMILYSKVTGAIFFFYSLPANFKKPKKCPPISNKILLYSARNLAKKIRTKEITSEAVVKAYIARITEINPVINAVVQERFDLAVEEAIETDSIINESSLSTAELEEKYPLLGVPLTVKESIAVKGLSHAAGVVFPEDKIASIDAEVIRKCKEAGAIVLAVSNTPELCINWETINKVTGRTDNPYDTRRTVGGSSGGEAALLASAASVIGMGSDICGSLRLPPHYCGVWGHKPSAFAVPVEGHYPSCGNETRWKEVFAIGPLSRYAGDLRVLLDVVCENSIRDRLDLKAEIPISSIRIYCMEDNCGSLITRSIHKDLRNGMRNLVSQLSNKHGLVVKQLNLQDMKYSVENTFITLSDLDDVENLFEGKGDGAFTELLRYIAVNSKSTLTPIMYGVGIKLSSFFPECVLDECYTRLVETKHELNRLLGNDGVLLYPSGPEAAHFHGGALAKMLDYSYMGIFNCLGFPVTQCPIGINSEGLPFGIQVVAGMNNDRLTLTVAEEIERLCGGWRPPPLRECVPIGLHRPSNM